MGTSASLRMPRRLPPRLLCKSNSEPHEVEDIFEGNDRATKAALEAGRDFADDLHNTSSIEFWLRSYVAHLRAAHGQFAASIARASDSSPLAGSQDTAAFGGMPIAHVKLY